MKRTRTIPDIDDDDSLKYPKILFIVNGENQMEGPAQAYIFQPYLGGECSRLISVLRTEKKTHTVEEAWRSFINVTIEDPVMDVTEATYTVLNRICLIDTKNNKIGSTRKIDHRQICRQGACQVEYLYLTEEIDNFLRKLQADEAREATQLRKK